MYPPLDPLYNPCNPRAPAVNVIACCGMDKFVNRHLSQREAKTVTTINSETALQSADCTGCYQRLLRLSRYQKLFTICFRLVHAHRGPPAQASPPNARIGASPRLILGSSL